MRWNPLTAVIMVLCAVDGLALAYLYAWFIVWTLQGNPIKPDPDYQPPPTWMFWVVGISTTLMVILTVINFAVFGWD